MVKPLYWYLVFTLFRPEIASNSHLLLHACTGLKSVFLGFVCRKGPPFTKNKSSDISTLWWFLAMPRGKGIIGVFLMLFPPYGVFAYDDWYMWFVDGLCLIDIVYGHWTLSYLVFTDVLFSSCSNVHPTICWSIIYASDTLISYLWKYYLLLSTVLIIV